MVTRTLHEFKLAGLISPLLANIKIRGLIIRTDILSQINYHYSKIERVPLVKNLTGFITERYLDVA